MDAVATPRPIPADKELEKWSGEIENLLSEWGEVAICYSYLHNYSTRKYRKKYHHLQIPIIILSTLTGTANFATDSYVPVDYQHGFSAGVGTLNIACGILGTLLAFLKYAEIYEGHRISALAWSKLSRTIEIELSLQNKKRKPCREFLKIMRSEYDNLLESSPQVDLDIINFFNKKFEGKYDDVRKPIICNGLREIIPYGGDKVDRSINDQRKPSVVSDVSTEGEDDSNISVVITDS
tara:strand:- start:5417 stop:6127 length:711 start_codon:yes stop_codon:yes gene_type:complete